MCGIVGFFTEAKTVGGLVRKDMFTEMLFADTFRGFDSTGVVVINHDGKKRKKIFKRALAAPDFINTRSYQKLVRGATPKIMIGHNRAATKGAVDDDSAHPFQYGNITLVHNGTLSFTHNLEEFTSKGFQVDSDYIAYAINKWGVQKVALQLQGSFSLVWYDSRDHSLNMLRNDQRPMNFAFLKDEDTVLFGSEGGLIDWIAQRNREELDDNGKIYNTKPGYWIKFTDKCRKFTAKEVKLYTPPPVRYYSGNRNNNFGNTSQKNLPIASSKTEHNDEAVLAQINSDFHKGTVVTVEVKEFDRQKNAVTFHNKDYPNVIFKCWGDFKSDIDFDYICNGGADFFHKITIQAAYKRTMGGGGTNYIVSCSNPTATNILCVDGKVDIKAVEEQEEMNNLMNESIKWIPSPSGDKISGKGFALLSKKGCRFCGEHIPLADAGKIAWDKCSLMPICLECTTNYADYAEKPSIH